MSAATGPEGLRVLPLIRWVSRHLTPVLARLPVTANQVTAASLVAGLAASAFVAVGGRPASLGGGVLLFVSYALDNSDGEIARLKNQATRFGERFDNFTDWAVHAAFFAALGYGVASARGGDIWIWLGAAAAAGATLNYAVHGAIEMWRASGRGSASPKARASGPRGWPTGAVQWVVFAFRELARADFCFLFLALAAMDATWMLLPAAAVGAHAYWATALIRWADEFQA